MKYNELQLRKAEVGEWEVYTAEGEKSAKLGEFSRKLTDREAIGVLELIKSIARLAYNDGKELGSGAMHAASNERVEQLLRLVSALKEHNTLLAEKLDDIITRGN
jgi:hypothetical protein